VRQSNEPAVKGFKPVSSGQMWPDNADVDDYNDDLLSQLREEDADVNDYNDELLSQLREEDDW
jgi:hypothetical protein